MTTRSASYAKIEEYCERYDIPIEYLTEVISDLKVIPMIRGKGFEFTISMKLREYLSSNAWSVENLNINAQQGIHDIDVSVKRLRDNREIRVECKLSKNNSFRNNGSFRVKCMRSRTFSDNPAAIRMAGAYGIRKNLLLMHADSYRATDFDFVFSTLGNSFWRTINGLYTFAGTRTQYGILHDLFPHDFTSFENFKSDSFNFIIYAKASDLTCSPSNPCNRRRCIANGSNSNCGFIPNYPTGDMISIHVWRQTNSVHLN